MAEALLAYARDPEAGTRDGEAGRALVERRYSLDTMADAYAELYRSVVRRRGAA